MQRNTSRLAVFVLVALLISESSNANAWISKNTTNKAGESMVYAQTYNVPGVGPTDNLGVNAPSAKTLTVGCSEGLFEIVLYEQDFETTDLLYMGTSKSIQVSLDGAKPSTLSVKKKSAGEVISIIDAKSFYKKLSKSKILKATLKVGGTSWIGVFNTSGLSNFSGKFSRYGCTV